MDCIFNKYYTFITWETAKLDVICQELLRNLIVNQNNLTKVVETIKVCSYCRDNRLYQSNKQPSLKEYLDLNNY